jgi:DNA-binding XRE family transcriptional regulator
VLKAFCKRPDLSCIYTVRFDKVAEAVLVNRRTKVRIPERSASIERFRHALKLSQHELGKRIGTSAMSVSRWESGKAQPSAEAYIKLGNMAAGPLCWYFWGQAGLSLGDVRRVLPDTEHRVKAKGRPLLVARAGVKRTKTERADDFVAVPLLPVFAATPGGQGDKEADLAMSGPERLLAAPVEWCPHPGQTLCIRVKGNSMSPLILDDGDGIDAFTDHWLAAFHKGSSVLLLWECRFRG